MHSVQNLEGTPDGAKAHMDGLEVLVASRGGLRRLRGYGIPRRLAAWLVDLTNP